jgi:hypothetical protein
MFVWHCEILLLDCCAVSTAIPLEPCPRQGNGANRVGGLRIQMTATNMVNELRWTDENWWPSNLLDWEGS